MEVSLFSRAACRCLLGSDVFPCTSYTRCSTAEDLFWQMLNLNCQLGWIKGKSFVTVVSIVGEITGFNVLLRNCKFQGWNYFHAILRNLSAVFSEIKLVQLFDCLTKHNNLWAEVLRFKNYRRNELSTSFYLQNCSKEAQKLFSLFKIHEWHCKSRVRIQKKQQVNSFNLNKMCKWIEWTWSKLWKINR